MSNEARSPSPWDVEEWLTGLGLDHLVDIFLDNGYDLPHVVANLSNADLDAMHVNDEEERSLLIKEAAKIVVSDKPPPKPMRHRFKSLSRNTPQQVAPEIEGSKGSLNSLQLKLKLSTQLKNDRIDITAPPYTTEEGYPDTQTLHNLSRTYSDKMPADVVDVYNALQAIWKSRRGAEGEHSKSIFTQQKPIVTPPLSPTGTSPIPFENYDEIYKPPSKEKKPIKVRGKSSGEQTHVRRTSTGSISSLKVSDIPTPAVSTSLTAEDGSHKVTAADEVPPKKNSAIRTESSSSADSHKIHAINKDTESDSSAQSHEEPKRKRIWIKNGKKKEEYSALESDSSNDEAQVKPEKNSTFKRFTKFFSRPKSQAPTKQLLDTSIQRTQSLPSVAIEEDFATYSQPFDSILPKESSSSQTLAVPSGPTSRTTTLPPDFSPSGMKKSFTVDENDFRQAHVNNLQPECKGLMVSPKSSRSPSLDAVPELPPRNYSSPGSDEEVVVPPRNDDYILPIFYDKGSGKGQSPAGAGTPLTQPPTKPPRGRSLKGDKSPKPVNVKTNATKQKGFVKNIFSKKHRKDSNSTFYDKGIEEIGKENVNNNNQEVFKLSSDVGPATVDSTSTCSPLPQKPVRKQSPKSKEVIVTPSPPPITSPRRPPPPPPTGYKKVSPPLTTSSLHDLPQKSTPPPASNPRELPRKPTPPPASSLRELPRKPTPPPASSPRELPRKPTPPPASSTRELPRKLTPPPASSMRELPRKPTPPPASSSRELSQKPFYSPKLPPRALPRPASATYSYSASSSPVMMKRAGNKPTLPPKPSDIAQAIKSQRNSSSECSYPSPPVAPPRTKRPASADLPLSHHPQAPPTSGSMPKIPSNLVTRPTLPPKPQVTRSPSPSQIHDTINIIQEKLSEENINLELDPYTLPNGGCGIPTLLVRRWAEETNSSLEQVGRAVEYIRLQQLQTSNRTVIAAQPRYWMERTAIDCSSVATWLASIGLSLYAQSFQDIGMTTLEHVSGMTVDQMRLLDMRDPIHKKYLDIGIDYIKL